MAAAALRRTPLSMRCSWLTHGKVPPTGLKPHDDLQAQFRYLGPPTPEPEVTCDQRIRRRLPVVMT